MKLETSDEPTLNGTEPTAPPVESSGCPTLDLTFGATRPVGIGNFHASGRHEPPRAGRHYRRPLSSRRAARPRRHGRSLSRRRPHARSAGRAEVPSRRRSAPTRHSSRSSTTSCAPRAKSRTRTSVRLYDLGEADGRRFLTMEYVDGEDLASLLRRIGRIPQDKAIELARQLCAGVAAAHERGVLHRDLKPANVMIDGEGNVRITDFGIATSGDGGDRDAGAFAGTPQYMAPEQLTGQPASVRTDLYALGLVLFEIFTGRRAYDAKTLGDLQAAARHRLGHDALVRRPRSRPGGRARDPAVPGQGSAEAAGIGARRCGRAAQAAIRSPRRWRPAKRRRRRCSWPPAKARRLSVGRGLAAVAFVAIGVIALAFIASRHHHHRPRPSRQAAGRSGRSCPAVPEVGRLHRAGRRFRVRAGAVGRVSPLAANGRSAAATLGHFEHRESLGARVLASHEPAAARYEPHADSGDVADPPMTVSGMTLVIVDTLGRVVEFQAVPSQFDSTPAPESTPPLGEALRRSRSRHEGVHAGRSAVVAARLRRYTRGLGRTCSPTIRSIASAWRRQPIAAVRRRCSCSARGHVPRAWRQ